MSIAYVGVGSNLNDPLSQVRQAIAVMETLPRTEVISQSSLYQNPPFGTIPQPDYVNAVVKLSTQLSATHVLKCLLEFERKQGRVRDGQERWGPRVIDMDLLLYDDHQMKLPFLTLPHPGIKDRPFVYLPLFEIEPDLILPDGTPLKAWVESHPEHSLLRFESEPLTV